MSMPLSEQEQKLIDQLAKRSRSWPKQKIILLVITPLLLVAWIAMFFYLSEKVQEDPSFFESIYYTFLPLMVVNCCFCGIMLGKVVRDWNGNALDILLLKVFEKELEEKNNS
jgi:hypothetical protein